MAARIVAFGTMLAFALGSGAAAERFAAEDIRFENVTGAVEIVSNSGDEIEVTIRQGKTYRQVQLALKDGVVVVTGEKWKEEDVHDCCNDRITRTLNPRQGRTATTGKPVDEDFFTQYPTVIVAMPRKGDATFIDARMKLKMDSLDGALNLDACYVYGEAGDMGEAVIGIIDGSRLVVGDIGAGLEIDVSGDADIRTGSASIVDVDIAGTGDVVLGEIDGMLDVSIAGSGSVRGSRLDGPLTARIAGSGVVAIQGGRAEKLRAFIDGSGAVFFDGAAVRPELKLYGSSEVHMASVSGRITRHGGGEVYVDRKLVPKE
ncbi:MAG: hypothetical protein RIC52_05315 [Amphiplicatus sp.]